MESFIAGTKTQFVEVALHFARNPHELQEIRQTLRARLLASDLCQGRQFVRGLHHTYAGLWGRFVKEERRRQRRQLGQQERTQKQ